MNIYNIANYTNGWFYGNFEPTTHPSEDTEVGLLTFKAGEVGDRHYHTKSKEINLVVSGKVWMNGVVLDAGAIFEFDPFEVSNVEFLEDTVLVVIKTPAHANDKVLCLI